MFEWLLDEKTDSTTVSKELSIISFDLQHPAKAQYHQTQLGYRDDLPYGLTNALTSGLHNCGSCLVTRTGTLELVMPDLLCLLWLPHTRK